MIQKPGSNHISYSELARTPEGLERWNDYMRQVTEIGLQRSEHFYPRTAREIIPEDAKRQRFYAFFNDQAVIDAFCVATISCGQAELLWANCRKGCAKSMMQLYDFIERDLFEGEYPVCKIIGMTCTEDTLIVSEEGDVIDGKDWSASHRFHENQGYRFTHRLDDFWEEGSHAFVFTKLREQYLAPREAHRYGYSKRDSYSFKPIPPKRLEDQNLDLNKRLYEQVWDYLDVFDETFVRSFPPEEKKSFVADKKMKGFTGLILSDCVNRVATIFATTSAKPDLHAETVLKFEYDIDASALTQMLLSDEVHDDVGILHYEADWDKESEISVATYCERLFPSLLEDGLYRERGFTVFYARRPGLNGHTSVLYFLTADIENVVWYKPLWKAFARYSFALVLEIYSYFSSLLVLDASLRGNDYFKSLIDVVSPAPTSGSDDDFLSKIARMKDAIQERIDAHYWAVVRAKESAIRHYGHTMGHRVSPIIEHFDKRDSESEAAKCARLVRDMSLVLQAYAVENKEAFFSLDNEKGGRFLDTSERLDLLALIKEDVAPFADKDVDVADCSDRNKKDIFHRYPRLEISLQHAYLGYCLTNPCTGISCRPHSAFYTQLISEIVINAVQHGRQYREDERPDGREAAVRVYLDTDSIKGKPALVISNFVGFRKPVPEYFTPDWERWPEEYENNGPGMAIAFFRALGIGDMWLSFEVVHANYGVLRVALTFDEYLEIA